VLEAPLELEIVEGELLELDLELVDD